MPAVHTPEQPDEELTEEQIRELAGTTELREIEERLRAKLHRLENPPWWDVLGRSAQRALRQEKTFVEGSLKDQRRLYLWMIARLLLGIGLAVWISIDTDVSLMGPLVALVVSGWAMLPWLRAKSYERGHSKGLTERRHVVPFTISLN